MKVIFNREYAKKTLAERQLALLDDQTRREILSEYWMYDNENQLSDSIESGECPEIDVELRTLICATDSPPDFLPDRIEPLLMDWLIFKLDKSLNSYISNKLSEFEIDCEVQGEVEPAGLCPCCEYFSIGIGEEGMYDICPVCFWENGGDGPNHMSLREAQLNFFQIGAINQRCLEFVASDGKLKYAKLDAQGE